jgi:transcriptional regulator with XRE-family HTH domain
VDRHQQRQPSPFAAYIRQRRKQLGLSQEEVARAAGEEFQASYVAKLERDAVDTPSAARVRKLAHALDVAPGDLGRLIFAEDGGATPELPPLPPRPLTPDPADVAALAALLRPRLPHVSDEQVAGAAYMLLALDWKSREELEAELGPSAALPPHEANGGAGAAG